MVIVRGKWVTSAAKRRRLLHYSIITNTRITNNFSKAFELGSGEVHSEPLPSTEQQGGYSDPPVGSEIRRTRGGVANCKLQGVHPPP